MQQQGVHLHRRAREHRHHLDPDLAALIVLSDQLLQRLHPLPAGEIRGVVFREVQEVLRQSNLLQGERGAVRLVFITLQQQIQQPVVRIRRAGGGHVNQKLGLRVRIANHADLGAKLVARHRELRHTAIDKGIESFRPLAVGVIPKDQAMTLENPLETVMDSLHAHVFRLRLVLSEAASARSSINLRSRSISRRNSSSVGR